MKASLGLCLIALLISTSGRAESPAPTAARAALDGHWRSVAPEALPPANGSVAYLLREFTFSSERWSIHFTLYADAALTTPLLAGDNAGEYILHPTAAESPDGPAEFLFSTRTLTPRSAAMAAALERAGCGSGAWKAGEAQSVFEKGCAAFRVFSRAECAQEFDRVALSGDRLRLGARPANGFLCTAERRATELGAPLVRAR